ncbi:MULTISPECIES: GFA family protein [unclassified Mesorhizobium]|uniref:GFA family protein n=1 Tax=unclassified Mesorhizobium TaxID=325217 RepID=UPI000FCAC854|nr:MULTISPECIES: GFA family protein [unclassified Mesorhizobium]RUV98980.1 GFA family protein [Mesorhizobium sp. M1A.F.Ca.IN.020.04.1.1]RUW12201.1 GFA family protein [Mesorhizobium sp. M1A.F.Ca.IN.020.03.1.1]RWF73049.1 MAG: GFA family protein [Mesorhizobium sp.]RWG18032.1 MAG: GFA family protein [Mesorhizobium sp.]RWG34174.1 MAG: GFA family protein [Mesorhizobium sp.]
MPVLLKGSCRCGAVRFEVESHTPVPFMLCYCSICRKQQGGGGFAINLGADNQTLKVTGKPNLGVYRAEIEDDEHPHCEVSTGERNFCKTCGAALWLYDPTWPDLVHPFASAIDSDLPKPPEKVHLMLKYKASWVEPAIGKNDKVFELYPEESIADWHKRTSSWVD